jgi:hypothetical protein
MEGMVNMPPAEHLFQINNQNIELFNQETADYFTRWLQSFCSFQNLEVLIYSF